jgi:hypothetical protein
MPGVAMVRLDNLVGLHSFLGEYQTIRRVIMETEFYEEI